MRAANLGDQFGEAASAAEKLTAAVGGRGVPPDVLKIQREIEVMRETDEALSRNVTLGEGYGQDNIDQIHHVPLRRLIRLDTLDHSFPSTVRIGCEEYTEKRPAMAGMTIDLEADWTNCSLEFYGAPGASAGIVELPAA